MFYYTKKPGIPHIDVSKLTQSDLVDLFTEAFEKEYDASQFGKTITENWDTLRGTIYCTPLATFGKKNSKAHNWFEAKASEMTPIIDAKRAVIEEDKRSPIERNLQMIRAAKSAVPYTAVIAPARSGQSSVRRSLWLL